MPGKPAARLTDNTAHGGLISGPGCPTVLIGKMPAACLGDMHVCPMATPGVPPIPHVGGPITLGSTGVFIGKKPAARMGDMAVCVGPPSSIIKGEMTVMIGEAGSGSQAGSAGAAAAAAKASTKGPNAVNALSIEQNEAEATEIHTVEIEFVDSAGNPVSGVPFDYKDPNGTESIGYSSPQGKWFRGGYVEAGSIEVNIHGLSDAKFSASSIETNKEYTLSAKADGFEPNTPAQIQIFAHRNEGSPIALHLLFSKVASDTIEAKWTFTEEDLHTFGAQNIYDIKSFSFHVIAKHCVAMSPQVSSDMQSTYQGSCIKAPFQEAFFLEKNNFPDLSQFEDLKELAKWVEVRSHSKIQLLCVNSAIKETELKAEVLLSLFTNDNTLWLKNFKTKVWDITELQYLLQYFKGTDKLSYYKMEIDGKWGSGSAKALKSFQADYDLAADGIAGPQTWSMFFAVVCGLIDSPNFKKLESLCGPKNPKSPDNDSWEFYFWQSDQNPQQSKFLEDPATEYETMQDCVIENLGMRAPEDFFFSY